MYAKVKNLNGTTDNYPPEGYSSWIDWWRAQTNSYAPYLPCANKNCSNAAEVGGHVKLDSNNKRWFIVPICRACNRKPSSETYLVDSDDLAPVR